MSLAKSKKPAPRIDKAAIEMARTGVNPPKVRSIGTVHDSCEKLAVAHCNAFYSGRCQAQGYTAKDCPPINCSSRMERAHIKSRGEKYIQFRPDNVTLLCNTHHKYFTKHSDAWTRFIESKYPGRWDLINDILNERRDTRVKTPLIVVYTACESWYKLGSEVDGWPWEPLCPEFLREAA